MNLCPIPGTGTYCQLHDTSIRTIVRWWSLNRAIPRQMTIHAPKSDPELIRTTSIIHSRVRYSAGRGRDRRLPRSQTKVPRDTPALATRNQVGIKKKNAAAAKPQLNSCQLIPGSSLAYEYIVGFMVCVMGK